MEFNKTIFKILNNKLSDFEKIICSYLLYGYNYLEISNILNKDKKKIDNAIQRIRKKVKFNSKLD